MNESSSNFGWGCSHYKVAFVKKGFPDLEKPTGPLSYNKKLFVKSLCLQEKKYIHFLWEEKSPHLASLYPRAFSLAFWDV